MLKVKLLKEAKIQDFESFEELWNKYPKAAEQIFDDIFRVAVLPVIKKLLEELPDFRVFMKRLQKANLSDLQHLYPWEADVARGKNSVMDNNFSVNNYLWFLAYFFHKKDLNFFPTLNRYFDKEMDNILVACGKLGIKVNQLVSLNKVGKNDTNLPQEQLENVNRNIENLEDHSVYLDVDEASSCQPLIDYKIGNFLGRGALGAVFQLLGMGNPKAIKFFEDAVDLRKDLRRMNQVIDQVYSKKADLQDMHYFEQGEVGTYYYAIMPQIVPLDSTQFWGDHTLFLINILDFSQIDPSVLEDLLDPKMIEDFRQDIKDEVANPDLSKSFESYLTRTNDVYHYAADISDKIGIKLFFEIIANDDLPYDEIAKVLKAIIVAKRRHQGEDTHEGNIGFLPQKPDIYFFYDM